MPAVRPKLSVIIVSYNTREMTLSCLSTLYAGLGDVSAEVWMVDNGSVDGSVAAVRAAYPDVLVIDTGENLGFGVANNRAMEQASGDYFLLLNSDAFPIGDAVTQLTAYMDQHPRVGVAGPRLLNADGTLQLSCFRFPSPLQAWMENLWITKLFANHAVAGDYRRWAHDRERDVDFVIGACMIVRREVFEKVGGFDPRFFMYAEETDWQRRIHDAGWTVAFTPSADVTHWGGASGLASAGKTREYFFASLDRYVRKHHGVTGLISMRLAMIAGSLMRTIVWTLASVAPKRREHAAAKLRLQTWLLARQTTNWAVANGDGSGRRRSG
ncbi:MAG: glycosyltransferase family 2 protein [Capsulimonadaceae bacterium]|nr:glycosyltransferase family 2 protein [Capsulimonadaceae bacterium]